MNTDVYSRRWTIQQVENVDAYDPQQKDVDYSTESNESAMMAGSLAPPSLAPRGGRPLRFLAYFPNNGPDDVRKFLIAFLTGKTGYYMIRASDLETWVAEARGDSPPAIEACGVYPDHHLVGGGPGLEELVTQILPARLAAARQHSFVPAWLASGTGIAPMPPGGVDVHVPEEGADVLLTLSIKEPTYYDLAVTLSATHTSLIYSSGEQAAMGMKHSGDILIRVAGEQMLTHSVRFRPLASRGRRRVQVWVSGYHSTPLSRFEKNRPVVFLMDTENERAYVVPVTLDRASAGEHTSCVVLVGEEGEGELWAFHPITGAYSRGDVSRPPYDMFSSLDATPSQSTILA